MNQNTTIQLPATIEIQAAADSGKLPTITILAYGGGMMRPPGWGDLTIDLAGLDCPPTVPILASHDNSIGGIVGGGIPQKAAGKLVVAGKLVDNQAGRDLVAIAKAGVPLQASVGVEAIQTEQLDPMKSVSVNGQMITASKSGAKIVRRGKLREVSVLPNGADATTSVTISAKEGRAMLGAIPVPADAKPGEYVGGPETDPFTKDDIPSAIRAERLRVDQIVRKIGDPAQYGKNAGSARLLLARAINGEATMLDVRNEILDFIRAEAPVGPQIRMPREAAFGRETLEAVLLIRAGKSALAEKEYGAEVMESTRMIRATSLPDICAMALQLDEKETAGMGRSEMIKAAFSTVSLPTTLGNAMGKLLLESYQLSPATWKSFCRILPAADFKPQVGIRPSGAGTLEQLGKGEELKHSFPRESTYPWSIGTFAKMISVDRQDIINDNLGFFDQMPVLFGKMGARSLADLIYKTILANAGSFFSGGNGNLLTAGSALSLVTLATAVSNMRKQRDADSNDLDITPSTLVVPPELDATARAIINSALIRAQEGDPMGNALQNIATLETESRLSNTAKFANGSATGWYLFGKPIDGGVIVGFLDGVQSPTVEFFGMDRDVNHLGISWRVYFDYGCSLGDFRAAVQATGAA